MLETGDGQQYTAGELDDKSANLALKLESLGMLPGDRLSLVAAKSSNFVLLYLACLRSGVIFNPLNPSYTDTEIRFFISDSESSVVFTDVDNLAKIERAVDGLESVKSVRSLDDINFEGNANNHSIQESYPDDTAVLIYSSGTTGTPKGICISHGNLSSNGAALRDSWGFSSEDVLLHVLPLYHVHGLFIILSPALLANTKILLLEQFEVEETIQFLERATMMSGVPTYYKRLLDSQLFSSINLSNIKLFISGSAPLPEKIFDGFFKVTGHKILERYGMTETGVISTNPLEGDRKPGSVGKPLDGVSIKIVDIKGEEVKGSEIGEIQVKGNNVFKQYWKRSTPVLEDDWFATGDLGYVDEEDYLFIAGRSKELIITGGMNVYPKEVERELDKIEFIGESAVFGIPHPDYGEAVMAAVVLLNGDELAVDIIKNLLKELLAGYKIPKMLVAVDELPRNSMGKVQKSRLQDEYRSYFKL